MHFAPRNLLSLACVMLLFNGFFCHKRVHHTNKPDTLQQLPQVAASPELPRLYLDASYTQSQERTINVSDGEDLQAAINAAKPGDVIELQAGATFVGNFILPNKFTDRPNSEESWIIIRSSAPDSCLPSSGTRITPENSNVLPKIITPNVASAVGTADGAHHYRLVGLEISVAANVEFSYDLVRFGDGSGYDSVIAHDLIIDRCYIHGNSSINISRGIALNSARTTIVDSYISEIHGDGFDTQAICGWNGPGPYKIANCYLEAAGENVLFGGADPSIIGLIPSDIEIRNSHFYKPMSWRMGAAEYAGKHWTVKNLLELKNAQRVLIEGNVFENNWADAQVGFALVFKSENQDGTAPWSVTRDVTFVNNVIRNSQHGLSMLGHSPSYPTELMQRVVIRNNLWERIDGTPFRGLPGIFLQFSEVPNLTVDHNTVIHTGSVISVYGLTSLNFVYTNNISAHNEYGVKGDGEGPGIGTLNSYLPNAIFTKNVLAGGISTIYPANNFFPSSLNDVSFTNPAEGVYRLASSSPYRLAGEDGKDLGCDFDVLDKVMIKVIGNILLNRGNPLPKKSCSKVRM